MNWDPRKHRDATPSRARVTFKVDVGMLVLGLVLVCTRASVVLGLVSGLGLGLGLGFVLYRSTHASTITEYIDNLRVGIRVEIRTRRLVSGLRQDGPYQYHCMD